MAVGMTGSIECWLLVDSMMKVVAMGPCCGVVDPGGYPGHLESGVV